MDEQVGKGISTRSGQEWGVGKPRRRRCLSKDGWVGVMKSLGKVRRLSTKGIPSDPPSCPWFSGQMLMLSTNTSDSLLGGPLK